MLNTNPMLPIDSLNNQINQYLPLADTVPIAIHFGELNAFKSDAVTNNLISIDGDDVLHDVPGRLQNPYLLKSLFSAAPLKSDFATGNFALVFKPNLFFSNSALTVSALYIDFDDGNGYQSAGWNIVLYPSYTTPGTKNIKLKLVMSNSSQYECYAPITVADIPALGRYSSSPPTPVHFYATGNHSGGRAFVRYSSSNSTGYLKKPLIVLEGWDAAQIAPNLAGNNYSYRGFIEDLGEPLPGYDFNYQLDDIGGYDLVFIDYNYGTDNIERNANLFKAVLNWVNANKILGGSTEQNVVLGISMGGLVARYGLAQMTKNNETTDTRLLITHDSPHQGANVPVGLQKVVQALGQAEMFNRKITDVFPQYNEVTTLLNEPASQQMLTYRSPSPNGAIQTNTWLNSTYRPMITFSPTNPQPSYRFIATSQGSECGTELFPAGSQLLNVQGNGGAVTIFLPGVHAKLEAQIKANALPAIGASTELSKVKFEVKIKYLFIRLKKEAFNHSYTLNSSPYLPIDGAPGGTSPVGSMNIAPQSMGGIIGFFLGSYALNLNAASLNNFNFVPTPSALDIQTYNLASLSGTYVNGWSPTNPSRAGTFIAQESSGSIYNETHTRFTARNAEWLFKEMENLTNNIICSSPCIPMISISGPSSVCSNYSTFQLENLSTGANVIWSVSPSLQIVSSSGNTVVVTRNLSNYDPNGAIYATLSGCYSSLETVKIVTTNVEASQILYTILEPTTLDYGGTICKDRNTKIQISSNTQDISEMYFQWGSDSGWPIGPLDTYGHLVSINPPSGNVGNSPASFYAEFGNDECGSMGWYFFTVNVTNCLLGGRLSNLQYYPNPADSELRIESYLEENILKDIKILDDKGKIMRSTVIKSGENSTILDTKDIPNGTYFLHITQGKEIMKKQIIIQH